MRQALSVIDLFAGAGGFSTGFLRCRHGSSPLFRVVAAVDNDAASAATFRANHVEADIFVGPIADWANPPEADVIIGGPPCQGFSQLGKEDPDDPRNKLWREYFRVVETVSPKAFVLENVSRFRASEELDALVRRCAKAGYPGALVLSLNAADFGSPQRRTRTFVIGVRDDLRLRDIGPLPTHSRNPTLDGRSAWRTVGDVFGPLAIFEPPVTSLPSGRYVDLRLFDGTATTIPGAYHTRELHVGRNPTAKSLERYRHIRQGENRHALPKRLQAPCWTRHKNGSGDVMGRLVWSEPSVTVRTEFFKPEKGRYLHPLKDRPITHMEAALLQGFAMDYRWCGTKLEIARQIGNAVPVPLAEAVAAFLAQTLTKQE